MKRYIVAFLFWICSLVALLTGCDIFDDLSRDKPGPTPNQILFSDNFTDDPSPMWRTVTGHWIVEGGMFTIEEIRQMGWKNIYLKTSDSYLWRDYILDVDIMSGVDDTRNTTNQEAGIILHAQNDLNKVLVRFIDDQSICWEKMIDGQVLSGECVSPGITTVSHVRIIVYRNTYTIYVISNGIKGNLELKMTFTDATFTQGMPGLAIRYKEDLAFDNFVVTAR